ncbi:MAG TPA: hypothetical protein VF791_00305 [Pyrinomonadaceae bacterium]
MPAKKSPAKRAAKEKQRTRKYYSASIISEPFYFADIDARLLRITFEVTTVDTRHSPTGETEAERSETVTRETTIPLDFFKDEAQCREWCNEVTRVYHETLSDALRGEAGIHFDLVTNMVLNDLGIVKIDLPGVIDGLAAMRAKGAKLSMHLPLKGRYSQWTPAELTLAIKAALRSIPEYEKKDYENVAARLKKSHPDKAPKSGDALRKLVGRLDLKWRDLKNGQ